MHDASPPSDTIQRRKLSQEVLDRLKLRITSGEFAPDEALPSERELMELYGVGRPAVREALQQLERWGMVTINHGERARVTVPSAEGLIKQIGASVIYQLQMQPESIAHLKEARLVLETGIAWLAAQRADAAGVAILRARHEAHKQAGLDTFLKCDIAFHHQIAVMTGNLIFPALIEGMLNWLALHYHALVRAPGLENLTLDEHQTILDAIAAGRPADAKQAMSDHLTRVSGLYGAPVIRAHGPTPEN